jgi:hypothetical protein
MSHAKKTKVRRPYLVSLLSTQANLSRYYFHNLFSALCLNQAWMLPHISTTQHIRKLAWRESQFLKPRGYNVTALKIDEEPCLLAFTTIKN